MQGLAGSTVVITGAASGIGLAAAERLLVEGATVVGTDITAPPASLADAGGKWIPLVADVRDSDAVAAVMDRAVEAGGRIDGVLNSAGVAGGGPVHQLSPDQWQRVLDINLTGTYLVTHHALARMVEQEPAGPLGRGSVVTVASVEGLEGTAGGSVYNASKGGVVLLTKNIAIDYGPLGIRANVICPGFIDTPLFRSVFDRGQGLMPVTEAIRVEHSLRRFGQASEIAAVAAFLLSADASFVTGTAIPVDGGYTAGRDHSAV